jgi:uncharacterized membrane protein
MTYRPPAGVAGRTAAAVLGADPEKMMDDDLAHLKTILEQNASGAASKRSIEKGSERRS